MCSCSDCMCSHMLSQDNVMQAFPSRQSPHMCSRSHTCALSLHLEGVPPSRLASPPPINSFGSGRFQACVCLYLFNLRFSTAARRARGAKLLPSMCRLAASACFGRWRPPLKPSISLRSFGDTDTRTDVFTAVVLVTVA